MEPTILFFNNRTGGLALLISITIGNIYHIQQKNLWSIVANHQCYKPRLSFSKTSIVIGWFLGTCPWSNSNISRSEYNWAVVVHASHVISAWLDLKLRDLQHVLKSTWLLNFASHSKEAKSKVLEQMIPSIFIIPSEFLFLIEIIKELFILAITFSFS